MSELDMDVLAEKIAARMAVHAPICRAFSAEELTDLKGIAKATASARKTAWVTLIGIVVVAAAGALVAGVMMKIRGN